MKNSYAGFEPATSPFWEGHSIRWVNTLSKIVVELRKQLHYGAERGIRTLVLLPANWFRVSPVMTTSISLRIQLLGILRENCELPIMSPACQFREKCRKREITGEKRRFHSHVCDQPNYVSSQSRYEHFDTLPYLSQHQHLRKRGELMGRTSKNIKFRIPEKPRKIKGFRSRGYRIATTISSQPRYDHFDISAY